MQFLALSRRRTDAFSTADFARLRSAETARIRELYAEGFIRQIWYRGDISGACVLAEAASEQEVRDTFQSLPMVAEGMNEVTHVVPLNPYAGFGPQT
jgi:muconolactone delta-isomerase